MVKRQGRHEKTKYPASAFLLACGKEMRRNQQRGSKVSLSVRSWHAWPRDKGKLLLWWKCWNCGGCLLLTPEKEQPLPSGSPISGTFCCLLRGLSDKVMIKWSPNRDFISEKCVHISQDTKVYNHTSKISTWTQTFLIKSIHCIALYFLGQLLTHLDLFLFLLRNI